MALWNFTRLVKNDYFYLININLAVPYVSQKHFNLSSEFCSPFADRDNSTINSS